MEGAETVSMRVWSLTRGHRRGSAGTNTRFHTCKSRAVSQLWLGFNSNHINGRHHHQDSADELIYQNPETTICSKLPARFHNLKSIVPLWLLYILKKRGGGITVKRPISSLKKPFTGGFSPGRELENETGRGEWIELNESFLVVSSSLFISVLPTQNRGPELRNVGFWPRQERELYSRESIYPAEERHVVVYFNAPWQLLVSRALNL